MLRWRARARFDRLRARLRRLALAPERVMELPEMEALLRNIDRRTERIEQILPTLPTRDEMHAAIRAAIEPLATRDELHAAIRAAIDPLATKAELREEGERTRRHFDVVAESLRQDIRLIAEGYTVLRQDVEGLRRELRQGLTALDRRLLRLETTR